jgi:hypothetical protein
VIASQDNRARALQLAAALYHLARMRTIAHQIAQNGHSIHTLRARVREASIERREIGVQIGEQGEFHTRLSRKNSTMTGDEIQMDPLRSQVQQTVARGMPCGNCDRSNGARKLQQWETKGQPTIQLFKKQR